MIQVCNQCGVAKPINEFPRNGLNKDGSYRYRPDCTICYNIRRKLSPKKHNKFVNNTKHRTGEEDTYSLSDWKDALVHFRGACAYCGHPQSRRLVLTKDHITCVKESGRTIRTNIIPACSSCNCSKADKALDKWYPKQPFFSEERMERIKVWHNSI